MSRDSQHRYKQMDHSSSEESLPDEWTSVQKRLDHIEASLIKLSKRNQKLQKRLQQQSEDMQSIRKDTRTMIEQIIQQRSNHLSVREKQLQFQNMRAELDDFHGFIKRIQKKNNEMVKELKSSNMGGTLSDSKIQDKIEEKVERMMQKHQNQTARAIAELRRMVSGYGKDYQLTKQQYYERETTPIDRKSSEKVLSNSRSKTNIQRSSQKNLRASHVDIPCQEPSIDRNMKSRSPQAHIQPIAAQPQPQLINNASSRVSYLRQKLKEFEQTNKKYQQKIEKKPQGRTPQKDGRTVQKLKDFKNYLEQSESQLDQSNLQNNQHNVLTDSIKNWKGQRYRYE